MALSDHYYGAKLSNYLKDKFKTDKCIYKPKKVDINDFIKVH